MVRRGYRDPPYHNWIHAFSVAHFCFLLIKNLQISEKKILGYVRYSTSFPPTYINSSICLKAFFHSKIWRMTYVLLHAQYCYFSFYFWRSNSVGKSRGEDLRSNFLLLFWWMLPKEKSFHFIYFFAKYCGGVRPFLSWGGGEKPNKASLSWLVQNFKRESEKKFFSCKHKGHKIFKTSKGSWQQKDSVGKAKFFPHTVYSINALPHFSK